MRGFSSELPQWRYTITFHDGSEIEILNSNNVPEQGGEELAQSIFRNSGRTAETITWSPVSPSTWSFSIGPFELRLSRR